MQKILAALRGLLSYVRGKAVVLWRFFRALALWLQVLIALILVVIILGVPLLFGGKPQDTGNQTRTVTLRSVAELSGNATGDSVIGTVRSRSEADVTAEASGVVKSVNTTLGASVPAGFIIASLENASESAAVLQAEGAYDAAVASQQAVSPTDVAATARNAYKSAFSTLDTTVGTYLDAFFGDTTTVGPSVLLSKTVTDRNQMSRDRVALTTALNSWRAHLATADSADPVVLLNEAEPIAASAQALAEELARSATASGSGATEAQMTALASARSAINGVVSSLASARAAWRAGSTSSTASVDASAKAALGTLRLAQANYEKTLLRAPIAGTVNFLPIRVGDYVTGLEHVATVAQNGALEIVLYVSEETAATLHTGATVTVEDSLPGIITEIAPALDPVTKQVEVHAGVTGDVSALTNGQSVRIRLPASETTATATSTGPVLLPLSAVKLSAGARVLFTVGEDGRLVALPVTIGDVRGDRIEITSTVPVDARVVEDARGLSAGDRVTVAP